ncbi:MAG: ferric reductase-like transmembrane domain-containing protein [Eggerthellaceae bacterium]|nr:ferric reductase-like transmembrane domain-containing protein [Eggerthellaceae bacterium]
MSFAVSLFASVALAVLLRRALKKAPVVFYVLAVALCVAAIYLTWNPLPSQVVRSIVFAIQKGHVGFSLFTLVMFIGVFDKASGVRRFFNPVRAELSILASIFIASHFIPYLLNYVALIASIFSLKPNVTLGFVLGIALLILLIPLAVTSFNAVRRRMSASAWKALQRWSYVFFILAYIHAISFLLVPALGGADTAMIANIALYSVVIVLYCILRSRRALLDKHAPKKEQESVEA